MAEAHSSQGIYLHQALLPLGIKRRCAVCDAPFEDRIRRGRPQSFCGAVCRQAQHKQQKLNWAACAQEGDSGR